MLKFAEWMHQDGAELIRLGNKEGNRALIIQGMARIARIDKGTYTINDTLEYNEYCTYYNMGYDVLEG